MHKEEKMITLHKIASTEDLWDDEWKNAYNFFNTKGNLKTKCKLKAKWKKEFIDMLKMVHNSNQK